MQRMAQFIRQPVALSLGFHVLVVTLFTVGWPFLTSDETDTQPLIVVDIVRTVPNTNLAGADSGGGDGGRLNDDGRRHQLISGQQNGIVDGSRRDYHC